MEKDSGKKKMDLWKKACIAVAVLLIALLSFFFVGSIAIAEFSCDYLTEGNAYYIWLPKSVSSYFEGERINLEFIMPHGGILKINGVVKPGEIGELRCGNPYEHSYFVSMTWREALELATSDKPITTFMRLKNSGKIIVSPKGIDKFEKLLAAQQTLVEDDGEPVPQHVQEQFSKYKEGSK
ncbi:MAG: hypothetical protein N3G22_01755 [Candidatus Micrarchaeota archaeon]|nr:hypothetical protein [Candidatus Micrarchaeota archaeon]